MTAALRSIEELAPVVPWWEDEENQWRDFEPAEGPWTRAKLLAYGGCTLSITGEPVPKSRARIRFVGKRVTSYTPRHTVLAQKAVEDEVRAAYAEPPIGEYDFGLALHFSMTSWQRRDVDNLAKLVLDAMTGVLWVDDSQVRLLNLSLDRGVDEPGTDIWVWCDQAQRPPTSPCGYCGTPLRTFPSWKGLTRFCSDACRGAFQTDRRARPCAVCGEVFTPLAKRPRVTCSSACFLAIQQQHAGRPRLHTDDPAVAKRRAEQRATANRLRHGGPRYRSGPKRKGMPQSGDPGFSW